jgi:hypothetical protein
MALVDLLGMIRAWMLSGFTIYTFFFGNDWLGFDIVKVMTRCMHGRIIHEEVNLGQIEKYQLYRLVARPHGVAFCLTKTLLTVVLCFRHDCNCVFLLKAGGVKAPTVIYCKINRIVVVLITN